MATLAQSEYCENRSLDPQDPQCAKVMISGPLIKVRLVLEPFSLNNYQLTG